MIDDIPVNFFAYCVEFHTFRFIDRIKQGRKRVAQVETAPAALADVENALKFFLERISVIELIGLPGKRVPGRRLETAFSPFAFVTHDPNWSLLRIPIRPQCVLQAMDNRGLIFSPENESLQFTVHPWT